jgi:hypothetical protein
MINTNDHILSRSLSPPAEDEIVALESEMAAAAVLHAAREQAISQHALHLAQRDGAIEALRAEQTAQAEMIGALTTKEAGYAERCVFSFLRMTKTFINLMISLNDIIF